MSLGLKCFLALATSFIAALCVAPLVIRLMKKLKAGQVILGYVEQHSAKSGTPTMGGFIFILPVAVVTLAFGYGKLSLVAVLTMLGYGLLGFLDDFLKIKTQNNLGLKPYQKIIGQLGIALIIGIFCYKNPVVGGSINLPFTDKVWDLKWWYVPFTVLVYVATTNAVNLTDGLDGLAGSVSAVYFLGFFAIAFAATQSLNFYGQVLDEAEVSGMAVFAASLVGGVCAFLWFNFNPAQIMMGDTGSLALGGAAASIAVFTKNPLLILLSGIMFVVSCISVILQVLYFKLTKKRIFLMAPLHHHLEKKGLSEGKIVCRYTVVTLLFSVLSLYAAGVI